MEQSQQARNLRLAEDSLGIPSHLAVDYLEDRPSQLLKQEVSSEVSQVQHSPLDSLEVLVEDRALLNLHPSLSQKKKSKLISSRLETQQTLRILSSDAIC